MIIALRPVIGFSAGFATMALVGVAGVTAPTQMSTLHASAGCSDKAAQPGPASRPVEAERPA